MQRKYFFASLIGSILILTGVGYVKSSYESPTTQEPIESEKRGTLREQVARAKARGAKQLVLSGVIANYEQVTNLDRVLTRYSLVVAQPVEERGQINEHDSISSWYRFKVMETLSQPTVPTSLPTFDYPAELLPPAADEILVPKPGGTVTIDDVDVTVQEQDFPAFGKSHKYLLFILMDPAQRVGRLDLGPVGAMRVKDDDHTLTPVGNATLPLQDEIQRRFGNSLDKVKERLKKS